MADDSKRLVVLKRLTEYLMNEVMVANGYQHDLYEGQVCRGRTTFGPTDRLPMVSILEALNPDREPDYTFDRTVIVEKWVILLQGFVADDKENPTDPAHALMADVKKALARIVDPQAPEDVYCLGGVVGQVWIEPGTVRPPTRDVSEKAFFYLRVILEFVENFSDPYSLD